MTVGILFIMTLITTVTAMTVAVVEERDRRGE